MLIWNVLCIIAAVLFIACITVLIVCRFRKNVYYKPYEKDELFKTTVDAGVKNSIYSTHGETREYIKRYVIRKSVYDNSVICNFNKNYEFISYYIIQYSRNHKVISITEVNERNTNNSSKIIAISKKCKHINVVVKKVEDVEINSRLILPLSTAKIRLFSLFASLACFSILFVLRHVVILIACQIYAKTYFESIYNLISILIVIAAGLLYYLISVLSLRRKSAKNRNGGALEYDFF